MLEIVDAFLGADGGKEFGDRALKFGCNAADFAHLESVANTQIEHPHFFLILLRKACQDSEIACGTCCKRQIRDASPFTAPYALTFSRESAAPGNALASFSRGRDSVGGYNHGS
jgi:hypothetical protein